MINFAMLGLEEFEQKLKPLEIALNTQDILDAASAYILFRVKDRYLKQEDPDGQAWPESFAARRRKAQGRDGGTGFDTGSLFHSISVGRSGTDRVVFTNVDYAEDFQNGPPERTFMETNFEDEIGVQRVLEDRIKAALP